MASGTAGYNAAAYGDNGWNDGAIISESGIAATTALGSEQASGGATINQVGYDNLRLSVSDLSENVTGTASVNTITGIAATTALGTEEASGGATINQVGYDNLRLSVSDLSQNISGTATVNTITGVNSTTSTGNVRLWSLVNTTSGGTETWTTGIAN